MLPKSNDINKAWLWSTGYLSLARQVLQKSSQETWSNFWLIMIATPYTPFENSHVKHLGWLKIETQVHNFFFSNLETCSQIPLFKWKAMLYIFTVHRIVFSWCIKMHNITCHTELALWHPPHVLALTQTVPIAHGCLVVAKQWAHSQG